MKKPGRLTGNGTGSTSTGKKRIGRKLTRRHAVTLMGGDAVKWTLAIPFGRGQSTVSPHIIPNPPLVELALDAWAGLPWGD